MRTRLVRPKFWTDSRMAELTTDTRLTYIGLWCLADDAGYLDWNHREIAAELYRYADIKERESVVLEHMNRLVEAERVQVLTCSRHALIPSIPDYRIKGGEQLFTIQKQHERRCVSQDYVGLRRTTENSVSVSSSSSVSDTSSARSRANGSKNQSDEERVAYYRSLEADESLPAEKRRLYGIQADAIEGHAA